MESTDLSALRRDSKLKTRRIAADYVADGLREAIQSGRLADGAVLSQAAIAEHFEVSRVPVREAMRQLLAEGLIQWRAHHVAVVRTLSPERIGELYDHRALLEGYITERSVPLIDEAAIKSLRSKNDRLLTISDHGKWLKVNAEFHDDILRVGGDETGLELIEWLRSRASRYVRMWSVDGVIHRPDEAGREHAEIIDLIERGDAAGARVAVESHIRHTGERLVAYGLAMDDGAVAESG
jgi:DNA-binding GntR family transcriptional regulator